MNTRWGNGNGASRTEITFTEAAALYGIPLKYLLDWKRTGRLNELNGVVHRGNRYRLNTALAEARLGLRRQKRGR